MPSTGRVIPSLPTGHIRRLYPTASVSLEWVILFPGRVRSLLDRFAPPGAVRSWRRMIDYSRQAELMASVPGGFAVNVKFHGVPTAQTDDDEPIRAIPDDPDRRRHRRNHHDLAPTT